MLKLFEVGDLVALHNGYIAVYSSRSTFTIVNTKNASAIVLCTDDKIGKTNVLQILGQDFVGWTNIDNISEKI